MDKYVGSYSIDEIFWSGSFAYLNGDGIGSKYLLKEFQGCPGFVQDWVKGRVKKIDKSTLCYTLAIPVFVTDTDTGKGEVKYYGAQIRADWDDSNGGEIVSSESFYPAKLEGMVGATRMVLLKSDLTPNSFTILVDCSLPDDNKNLNEGVMYLTFKKK
ncbi:MAG: hypothetical protein IKZ71_01850 [Bacteroidales bacterium]|nr:hypothetical protein [Bacteroidales bacterium]